MHMATLQQRLTEAETAYHSLRMGKGVAEFRDQNGETVRYTKADMAGLKAYIAELKAEIAAEDAGTTVNEGPLRPVIL